MDEKTGELNQSNTQMVNLNPYFQIDFGKGIYAKTTLGVNTVSYTHLDVYKRQQWYCKTYAVSLQRAN